MLIRNSFFQTQVTVITYLEIFIFIYLFTLKWKHTRFLPELAFLTQIMKFLATKLQYFTIKLTKLTKQ